jgi:hypothetical protein
LILVNFGWPGATASSTPEKHPGSSPQSIRSCGLAPRRSDPQHSHAEHNGGRVDRDRMPITGPTENMSLTAKSLPKLRNSVRL